MSQVVPPHVEKVTVRDLGTKVRSLKPFATTAKVVAELLSTARIFTLPCKKRNGCPQFATGSEDDSSRFR